MKFSRFYLYLLGLLVLPAITLAQGPPTSIQTLGESLIVFFNLILVPFLFALALLIFVFNVVRYFIIDINSGFGEKEKARRYALYSIIGFVLMSVLWGIVNLVVDGLGLARSETVCPDYVPEAYCVSLSRAGAGVGVGGMIMLPAPPVDSGPRITVDNPGEDDSVIEFDRQVVAERQKDYLDKILAIETQLETKLFADASNIAELDAADARIRTIINILSDFEASDQTKIDTLSDLAKDNLISDTDFSEAAAALNEIRSARGETVIFVR